MAGPTSSAFFTPAHHSSTLPVDEDVFPAFPRRLTPRNSSHYRFYNYSGKKMRERARQDLLYSTTATTQAGTEMEHTNTTTTHTPTISAHTTSAAPTPISPLPRLTNSPFSSPMGTSPTFSTLSSDSGSSTITQNFAAKYKPRSRVGSEKFLSAQSLREKRMREDELMMRAKNYARMEVDRSTITQDGASSNDSYYTEYEEELWACPCGGECAGCKVW